MIVTAVERQRRRGRVDVFVEGHFALTLGADLAAERDVRPGRALTQADLAALAEDQERRSALEAALRLLSYRPRSERELRDRLARKGARRVVLDATIGRLRELGYVNDEAFARFWTETRQSQRPGSQRLRASELRWRGVGAEEIAEATSAISDDEAAYEAASRRLRPLRGLEYRRFRERLGGFLTRRGFSYDIARRTIDRCWEETGEAGKSAEGEGAGPREA